MNLFSVLCVLSLIAFAAEPESQLRGKVIHVANGDTLNVIIDNKIVTVRLEGIDCPNVPQAFGAKATKVLKDLVDDKDVMLTIKGVDPFRRTIGIVRIDGVNVNAKLVEEGLAWCYKQYNTDVELGAELAKLEAQAREAKRGLWADRSPTSPWDFEGHRPLWIHRRDHADRKPMPR